MSAGPARATLQRADELGHEARVEHDDHASLKLWLRLLACTTQIEGEIRRRLRARFGISLARFDYLAQLYRHPAGLRMKEISSCLMVTGGNVTGLTAELEREGLVQRDPSATDRRSWIVRLTPAGRGSFRAMAAEHEAWLIEIFSGMEPKALDRLHAQLGTLRARLAGIAGRNDDPRRGPTP